MRRPSHRQRIVCVAFLTARGLASQVQRRARRSRAQETAPSDRQVIRCCCRGRALIGACAEHV